MIGEVSVAILAELSFAEEVLVALISGGLAAAGAGTAVYTQLAVSSQRREARNHVLDEILTLEELDRCYTAAALIQRRDAHLVSILSVDEIEDELAKLSPQSLVDENRMPVRAGWAQAYANKNGPTLVVAQESLVGLHSYVAHGSHLVHESSEYLRRASGYDAWVLRRLFNAIPPEKYGDALTNAFVAYRARKFIERRLRTSNPISRVCALIGDTRRCRSTAAFEAEKLPAPERDEESMLEDLDLHGELLYPDEAQSERQEVG